MMCRTMPTLKSAAADASRICQGVDFQKARRTGSLAKWKSPMRRLTRVGKHHRSQPVDTKKQADRAKLIAASFIPPKQAPVAVTKLSQHRRLRSTARANAGTVISMQEVGPQLVAHW